MRNSNIITPFSAPQHKLLHQSPLFAQQPFGRIRQDAEYNFIVNFGSFGKVLIFANGVVEVFFLTPWTETNFDLGCSGVNLG